MSRLLHDAAIKGELATVETLLRQGTLVDQLDAHGWSALLYAADNEHPDVVRLLLDYDAAPNLRNPWGQTALMKAAGEGSAEVVRDLLARGANASLVDDEGLCALDWARLSGCEEVIALLRQC